jgi:carbon monoxide dehydrogenase subunit G
MAVKFDQTIGIDAPLDQVWAVLTDPTSWSDWLPDVDDVTGLGSVEEGGSFQWRAGSDEGQGTISEVNPSANRLKIVTQGSGGPVTHTFDVDRAGGAFGLGGQDARLRYTMEYDPPGGAITDFIAGGNPMDMMKVKKALERVRDLAQMRG